MENTPVASVQKEMENIFENIIEKQLDHMINASHDNSVFVKQIILRDFRNIFISRKDYMRVCQKGGAFGLLDDYGSGMFTNWFLYNSKKRNRLFMIWIHNSDMREQDIQTSDKNDDTDLGMVTEQNQEENDLYCFCKFRFLNTPANKVMGGFRDDVSRIIQT